MSFDLAPAVLQLDQDLDHFQHVIPAQHAKLVVGLETQPGVHLHPADRRQVVAVMVEEQATEQRVRRLEDRRLARAHDPVDVDQRFFAVSSSCPPASVFRI